MMPRWFEAWLAGAWHLVGVTALFMLIAGALVAHAWVLWYVVLPRATRALARLEARWASNDEGGAPEARWKGVKHHDDKD